MGTAPMLSVPEFFLNLLSEQVEFLAPVFALAGSLSLTVAMLEERKEQR
jgi:hypothetical protein